MNERDVQELEMDAMRSRIILKPELIRTINDYVRRRRVRYSPEYLVTWHLFKKQPPILYAFWDVIRELYRELERTSENALTRTLKIENPSERIEFGYKIPATLGIEYLEDARRRWLIERILKFPLMIKEWVFACAMSIHRQCSFGEAILVTSD
jgi:hypothetical protein